ncbi:hypothetical protein CASFOL_035544 [Castilleja foliolosa]|uniref:RecA family profile 1 domain-containing protein n=1 Tax=Castilleja foliolosa TaxID=1961234 RepID=A0ABD3BTN6_9LAMI
MAPLEALERDYPLIDSRFRMFCASHGIFTVQDFLVHDHYELEAFAERDYAWDKLKQNQVSHFVCWSKGIAQMVSNIESMRRPWLNGLELLEDAQLNKGTLSTGCERIDVLLQGGLREGHVTELVGQSSSGKTQVCLKAASHVVRKYSGKVMFFDTGNSFSAKRIAEFLSRSSTPADTQVNKTVQQEMRNIVCHSVFDIFTLLDMLQQLMNNLKSQISCQVRMLIVDSVSSLIAPILGGGGTHELTNHMVAGEFGISKPALGESWKSIPHVRLMLSRGYTTNANGSCISILKHPYLASGKTTEFMVM